jgi:formylglycine-generating enzyme required for sulfatase activity
MLSRLLNTALMVAAIAAAELWAANGMMRPLPQMIKIPAGTFDLGTPDAPLNGTADGAPIALSGRLRGDFDERPVQANVSLPAFFLAATEVTNAMYEQFDPAHRQLRGLKGFSTGDDEAVVFVSFTNATAYCDWLTQNYHTTALQPQQLSFRLPTEVEWEFAARAGRTSSNFWYGDDFNTSESNNNANKGPAAHIHPPSANLSVAKYAPNPLGIYDCHGNVEEWTSTAYALYGRAGGNAAGLVARDTVLRVTRGGSHSTQPFYLRLTNRAAAMPEQRSEVIGLRVAASAMPAAVATPAAAPPPAAAPAPPAPPPPPPAAAAAPAPAAAAAAAGPAAAAVVAAAAVAFFGPFEYIYDLPLTASGAGPLFAQHNHAPAVGLMSNGTLIVTWFSCVSESGREPAYAFSTLDLAVMIRSGGRLAPWIAASLFLKIADRGQQTCLFRSRPNTSVLEWYASIGVAAGYWNGDIVKAEMDTSANVVGRQHVRQVSAGTTTASLQVVSGGLVHGDGHIPFERIVDLADGTLAMTTTVLLADLCCSVCSAHCSAVLLSHDEGQSWVRAGAGRNSSMAGISQFVELKNGSWFALGRMSQTDKPTAEEPGMSR